MIYAISLKKQTKGNHNMTKEQLKEWRASQGLTQRNAAPLFGAGVQSYKNWEQGRVVVPEYVGLMIALLTNQK